MTRKTTTSKSQKAALRSVSYVCRWFVAVVIASLLGACTVIPTAGLDESLVAGDHRYMPKASEVLTQPNAIINRFFPDPPVIIETPAFSTRNRFTSQHEMLGFIDRLRIRTSHLHVLNLGFSQQGRRIPMLVFTLAPGGTAQHLIETGKPTVWVHAQLHGNEPAAGEGALALAGQLADKLAYVLDRINVVIVPRVNVDGSAFFERNASNQRDLNRDSLRLDVQESLALRRTNIAYGPAVTVDAHEYYAARRSLSVLGESQYLESHDLLVQGAENGNVPRRLRELTSGVFLNNIVRDSHAAGLRVHPYYTVRIHEAEEGGGRYRIALASGGSDARIGRNFHGLLNQVSILLESRGIGIGRQSFRRRVYSQLVAMQSVIETAYRKAPELLQTIRDAQAEVVAQGAVTGDSDPLILRSRRTEIDSYVIPYINTSTRQAELIETRYLSFDPLVPVLERERPFAYILTPEARAAVVRLEAFGVQVLPLGEARLLPVEAFRVVEARHESRPYEGVLRRRTRIVMEEKILEVPSGSSIVYMSQPLGNLIAELLEPEAGDSFVTFGVLKSTLDQLLPIYRYMDPLGV